MSGRDGGAPVTAIRAEPTDEQYMARAEVVLQAEAMLMPYANPITVASPESGSVIRADYPCLGGRGAFVQAWVWVPEGQLASTAEVDT